MKLAKFKQIFKGDFTIMANLSEDQYYIEAQESIPEEIKDYEITGVHCDTDEEGDFIIVFAEAI